MTHQQRLAGLTVLAGIIFALAWRIAVAPAVLGDFDPASMPHRDRAFLSIGNVAVAALMAVALVVLLRLDMAERSRRFARAGAGLAVLGAFAALAGTVGLLWWHAAVVALSVYVLCAGTAWALIGYAMFHEYRGVVGWTALATAVVYVMAVAVIFAGGFVIFLMTVGAAPFAIGLIACPARHRHTPDISSATLVRPSNV
jgi:hypothetical protein